MSTYARIWAAVTIGVAATELGFAIGPNHLTWVAPTPMFLIVVVAAIGCAITAGLLAAVAYRNNQAELGFVAAFFMIASLLPLTHGLTIPGVIYDDNTATAAAVFWTVPLGLVAISPTFIKRTALGMRLATHWRQWFVVTSGMGVSLSVTMLIAPNLVPVPEMGSASASASVLLMFSLTAAVSYRHVRLANIAQHAGPLVIGVGYVMVGASTLVFVAQPAWAPHFWVAHLLDIGGVFIATIGGIVVYERRPSFRDLLAPVVAVDPHLALEVGLSAPVHEFLSDLENKDKITRNHVIRAGELTVDVGTELGLSADELRLAALVGLLHDVGKLAIPDEILNKPGKLTDAEFEIIKQHTVEGERLLTRCPALADLAILVRGHHERIDGRGYPDGLRGPQIPFVSKVVAVCDAYDAMTFTRQYRQGMSRDRAHAILREHAGSQWDTRVVEAVIKVTSLAEERPPELPRKLDNIGRIEAHNVGCGCVPDFAEPELVAADLWPGT